MTRSMAKTKQAEVPSIYPLKGEHKKPEHTKQVNIDREVHEPKRDVPDAEEKYQNLVRFHWRFQVRHHYQCKIK